MLTQRLRGYAKVSFWHTFAHYFLFFIFLIKYICPLLKKADHWCDSHCQKMFRLKEKTKGGWLVLQIGHWKSFWPCKLDLPTQYADRDVARWEIDQMDKFLHLHCHIFHHYEWNSRRFSFLLTGGWDKGTFYPLSYLFWSWKGLARCYAKLGILTWIKGFSVNARNLQRIEVMHLFYANDTLILCGAEENQLRNLRVILLIFEAV